MFTLGTRLTRVTRQLRLRDPDLALAAAGTAIPDWSGGTRLGEALRAFLDLWGQRGTARRAVVVIACDGWERGDAQLLGEQMQRLARLAHRVVWVNPHRGKRGFAPITGGMVAALPHVDELIAGHSLDSLRHLGGGDRPCVTSSTISTRWWCAGDTVGIGTVVGTWKSSPRQPGAAMLVGPDGTAVGSVSGGCVEGAVYALAERARDDGTPVLQRYGVSDDDAFAVGLTCGGIIDIFVEQVNQQTFPRTRSVRRRHRERPSGRRRDGDQRRRRVARPAAGGRVRIRSTDRWAATVWTTRSATTRAGCSCRARRPRALRRATANGASTTSRSSSRRTHRSRA